MIIDYKKELEQTAKNMILVHEPERLIKIILHMLIQKVRIDHASILLHHKDKDVYILTDSRGSLNDHIPVGFARMDKDDALIRFFKDPWQGPLAKSGVLVYADLKKYLHRPRMEGKLKEYIKQVLRQMEILKTAACIPAYFRDDLLGILLLGNRSNRKAFAPEELNFFVALTSNVAMAIKNAQLFKELESELEKEHQLFLRIIFALAAAIEAKDYYTHGHTSRVTRLSLEIAQKLNKERKIFSPSFFEDLHIASLLHDIGKIGIPEGILNKTGPLDNSEMDKIKEHPLIGVNILQPIKELQDSILGVKYHHERYDGTGYPEGLRGEKIPLIASIISVADSFDAMITDRPYRRSLYRDDAISEIRTLSGSQFNPNVAEAFIALCKEKKI